MKFDAPLPIDAVLDDVETALTRNNTAVLVAPPGAGKTTRVPLVLRNAPWVGDRRILVLEPRRIAARGAAARMAKTLGEAVGETVGIRARLGTRVSGRTRIEVVTEGVFTRMILDDPGLEGVAAILFDEYHERSLDADVGLAFALDAQRGLREDLRVMPMSATLDGARVARLLGDGTLVIESEGRAFPVDTRYLGRDPRRRIDEQMVDAIATAFLSETGSILAFLPGQGEILRTADRLAERIRQPDAIIAPLYGAMDVAAQDRAVSPAPPGKRKIVLATSIAETSITIEGVRVVIDCGLARVPRFEPDVGVTRLQTVRVSRATAEQRRGRAGRTEPGICYRLWEEPETQSLPAFAEPEIRNADLSALLLDCAAWGATNPSELPWLDPPPPAAIDAARERLLDLAAIDRTGQLTPLGRRIRELPLPAPLARMILSASASGATRAAADIAAVIVERGLGGNDVDLDTRLAAFRRDRGPRATDARRMAERWAKAADAGQASDDELSTAALLALAYPDRIAKARGGSGQFLLANGRGASIDATDAMARAPYLVVADLAGSAGATRILAAAKLAATELETIAADRIERADDIAFDVASASVRAKRVRRLGAITLEAAPVSPPATDATAGILAEGIAAAGIDKLSWSKSQQQLRERIAFLRSQAPDDWPDLSDAALAASVGEWLRPMIIGKTKRADITPDDLQQALDALLPWNLKRRLDDDAPSHFATPAGNRHPIDYDGPQAPRVAVRVQELFGLTRHPAIAGGRRPLTLELLSPAHRPIQVTRDLPGFWAGSWKDVRADMRGQYPKHVWPEDPANAAPTSRAKPRGT